MAGHTGEIEANERVIKTELTKDGQYLIVTKVREIEIVKKFRLIPAEAKNGVEKLTYRELDVLELIAAGCTNKEAADELCIGVRTVESHRANLMGKLGVTSRRQLVQYWNDNHEK